MAKAVLISIRPKWVEKILSGEKTLNKFTGLRKTKFGEEPVEIQRPPQSWCYVEELEHE